MSHTLLISFCKRVVLPERLLMLSIWFGGEALWSTALARREQQRWHKSHIDIRPAVAAVLHGRSHWYVPLLPLCPVGTFSQGTALQLAFVGMLSMSCWCTESRQQQCIKQSSDDAELTNQLTPTRHQQLLHGRQLAAKKLRPLELERDIEIRFCPLGMKYFCSQREMTTERWLFQTRKCGKQDFDHKAKRFHKETF